ncbi:MAG: type III-B CRISPR module-associated protein Cmr3 [Anaerolineae bacterium]|nr:type III-B CRISPR module-associated protein Cmr3 [Anaerolineae bacterium]
MHLFLEPTDIWLFRDGKPFNAGSDHRAQSLFPPHPTVIQGAIRSHELVLKRIDLQDPAAIAAAVGTSEDYGPLRLRGPIVARRDGDRVERYYPVPADVQVQKDGNATQPVDPAPPPDDVVTSIGDELPLLLFPREEAEKEGWGRWLAEKDLMSVLRGGSAVALEDGCLFQRESRLGIERDQGTGGTVPERLYQAEFVRPRKDVGLWVEVQGYRDWPAAGHMRIGGEGRAAQFWQVSAPQWPGLDLSRPLPQRFRLYFATPSYFSRGWRPKDWATFFDGPVTLEAVALKGYQTIGGFDWVAGRQKASRRFVPAGSVYYFTTAGSAQLRSELINQAVTEWGGEIGFGQVIVVEWRD